jgi:predicted PolB exonuclease-like 3'-5' exonuclease
MRHSDASWIVFDIESAPRSDATNYLKPVKADGRLTDEAKIAADIEDKKAAQLEQASLDWNTCRIVALGTQTDASNEPSVITCPDETVEKSAIERFWTMVYGHGGIYSSRPILVGYNVLRFDLPVLIQRSRYLGVKAAPVSLKPYDNRDVMDLFRMLTFDDVKCTSVMERSLDNFCRQFGIDITDVFSGEDIPRLVRDGRWDEVREHCRCDVLKEVALARALGVIKPALTEVA